MTSGSYAFTVTLGLPLPQARQAVLDALQKEKFGVISEIDIAAKLKEKLGIDHPPHVILGACNPALAHQALQENPDVALALPCNVVLRADSGRTVVSALLPSVALKPFAGTNVQKSACTAEEALRRVFTNLPT
ncbi:MAG: DUF302 domain-containing protein [Candidatus Peribacteraceae bacterium]|nr:DUF302 domain-containing protein [Candidatus Peribacteraceae bacterium]MDD5742198.1 DUF302 domain-containing protein [Candidatus Peribacteraceae bacterium]